MYTSHTHIFLNTWTLTECCFHKDKPCYLKRRVSPSLSCQHLPVILLSLSSVGFFCFAFCLFLLHIVCFVYLKKTNTKTQLWWDFWCTDVYLLFQSNVFIFIWRTFTFIFTLILCTTKCPYINAQYWSCLMSGGLRHMKSAVVNTCFI